MLARFNLKEIQNNEVNKHQNLKIIQKLEMIKH